jgi:hypothetical protein
MNMIFRPRNDFGNDISRDNTLELNITVETLQFMSSTVLGKIPNKGFDDQPHIDLTGIPYMQTVSETLDVHNKTVNLDVKKVDLHFEQGLLLRTPPTKNPVSDVHTLARLGSIPHGTTINIQDTEPDKTPINNGPKIGPSMILPFNIQKKPTDKIVFIGQKSFDNMNIVGDVGTDRRKPRDLTGLEKIVTMESLNNPNKYLEDHNRTKNIRDHYTFTLKSRHDTLPGGGVANIGFLSGGVKPNFSTGATGNANATNVTCQYWVSTVLHKVVIPKGDWTKADAQILLPTDDKKDVPGPQFRVDIKKNITKEGQTIDVTSTQIQYSQNVRLDFGTLSWPHISVATLAPALPINILSTNEQLKALK